VEKSTGGELAVRLEALDPAFHQRWDYQVIVR
jgi:hypothetical protein